jgi:hypothetical protein
VKNINIITNNISLSGWTKNDFLNYIKSINLNQQIIFNTLNYPNSNSLSENFQSFDSTDEFLKDIATAGGGTYYNFDSLGSIVDSYESSAGLVPLTSQPVYTTCDEYYPINSQPPIESPNFRYEDGVVVETPKEGISDPTNITDSRSGYLNIDIIPIQVIPEPPTEEIIPIPPFPSGDIPPIIPNIQPAGPIEDAPPQATPIPSPSIPVFIGGGGGGRSSNPGPSPNPPQPAGCTERNKPITFTITSREWKASPTTNGNPCKCQKEGTYVVKGKIYNSNCIGKNVSINGTITITDKYNGSVLKKYEGSTTVGVNGSNGEPIPKEPPSPFDPTKPTPTTLPLSTLQINPNVQGIEPRGADPGQSVPSINKNDMNPSVQGIPTNTSKPSVQGIDSTIKNVGQGMNLDNSTVGKGVGVQGLKTTLF